MSDPDVVKGDPASGSPGYASTPSRSVTGQTGSRSPVGDSPSRANPSGVMPASVPLTSRSPVHALRGTPGPLYIRSGVGVVRNPLHPRGCPRSPGLHVRPRVLAQPTEVAMPPAPVAQRVVPRAREPVAPQPMMEVPVAPSGGAHFARALRERPVSRASYELVVHELRLAKRQRDHEQCRARQFQDDIQIHLKQKAELATARDNANALADSRADEIKDLRNSMETDPDREAERDSAAKRIARLQKKLDASNLKYQDLLATVGSKSLGGVAPAGASSADMHKVLNRPGAFDGESTSTISVVDWLVVVKHYFRAVQQPRAKWVTIASSYLRGEAMRFWANRKKALTKPEYNSWLVFKTALLERFDSENTAVSARLRLDALSQGDLAMPNLCTSLTSSRPISLTCLRQT